jgi:hypothetical protein
MRDTMGKKGTSGGGTVRTREDGTKEAKRKRSKALADLIKNGRGLSIHAGLPSGSG